MNSWTAKAACKGMPLEPFFPDYKPRDKIPEAPEICGQCPVREDCLSCAQTDETLVGYWGGRYFSFNRKRSTGRWRSQRPVKIVGFLLDGMSRDDIGDRLGLKRSAVDRQLDVFRQKYGAFNIYQAISESVKAGDVAVGGGYGDLDEGQLKLLAVLANGGTMTAFRLTQNLSRKQMSTFVARLLNDADQSSVHACVAAYASKGLVPC